MKDNRQGGETASPNKTDKNTDYISMMENILAIKEESRRNNPEGFTLEQINSEIAAYRRGH